MGKSSKSKASLQLIVLSACAVLASMLFVSITVVLFVGMLPTVVPVVLRRMKFRVSDVTVGVMNLAGCMPFVAELLQHRSMSRAFEIVADPFSIVIIYMAAAFGYAIDWAVTGVMSKMLYQKGKARRKVITKRQEALVTRWGENVTGDKPLDYDGFPIQS